ncbi:hypothetical protein ACWDSJ_00030 [Nocardia sp. NPDC003482]
MSKALLVTAAVYLAAIGLALLFAPARFGVGAVPEDATPQLLSLLRLLGGPMLGIAVLNWRSRDVAAPAIRDTVVLANFVGFGVVAGNDVWGVLSGEARDLAKVFLVVHLAFAISFALTWFRALRGGAPAPARS